MIKIKIDQKMLNDKLSKIAERLQNKAPLMCELSGDMMDAVTENFAQEGRPKWLPIQRAGQILRGSGRLAASITPFSDNDSAIVGTNVKYAAIHQFGGTTRPHVIRPRYKRRWPSVAGSLKK